MNITPRHVLAPLAAAALLSLGSSALAAEADKPLLPGGASSLQENYEDWQVACTVADKAKQCILQQVQTDGKSGRRVLSISLQPTPEGGAAGALVMPFGLSLDSGVSLSRDAETTAQIARFSTCLPAGCIVPLKFDPSTLAAYRKAKMLKLAAKGTDGKPFTFTVSIKGLGAAFDRTAALLK